MTAPRIQIALISTNPVLHERLGTLAGFIDNETHFPRLRDLVRGIDELSAANETARLLNEYKLPYAVVAVTDNQSAMIFDEVTQRVSSVLVMCPTGYRQLSEAALRRRPKKDVKFTVLVGKENEFPNYSAERFGEPTYLPLPLWTQDNLVKLADRIRRVAEAKSLVC